jgi:hypothetical protein
MILELRTYTVNKDSMDAFLEHFEKFSIPLHAAVGIKIDATYVNRPQNEFIWIRFFDNEEDRAAKTKAFLEERDRQGIQLGQNIAKMEHKTMEVVDFKATALA